jgi:lysophospholipase L1-like esterase
MRKRFGRLLIAVTSLVISLLLCELIARWMLPPQPVIEITHPSRAPTLDAKTSLVEEDGHIDTLIDWSGQHGIRLRPNRSVLIKSHLLSHQDVRIETNSLGLRYRELGPKSPGERRILVLGDSITLADYVDEQDSFPILTERLLGEDGHREAKVINAGLPGASTKDEYYEYLEVREQLKPDAVIVAMYLNDVINSEKFYVRSLRFPYSKSRLLTWLVNRLHIFELTWLSKSITPAGIDPNWKEEFRAGRNLHSGRMFDTREGFDFEIYNAAMDFGLAWNSKSWDILTDIVAAFQQTVLQSGARFGMILLPVHLQVLGSVGDVYPQTQFSRMCDRLGIACLDLLPALRQAAERKDVKLYYDHCHLTAPGNAAVASAIKDWLEKVFL